MTFRLDEQSRPAFKVNTSRSFNNIPADFLVDKRTLGKDGHFNLQRTSSFAESNPLPRKIVPFNVLDAERNASRGIKIRFTRDILDKLLGVTISDPNNPKIKTTKHISIATLLSKVS